MRVFTAYMTCSKQLQNKTSPESRRLIGTAHQHTQTMGVRHRHVLFDKHGIFVQGHIYQAQQSPRLIMHHTQHSARHHAIMFTFMKPMSLAYSRKHCRHTFRPYFRMSPHWLLHTRLQQTAQQS